MFTFQPKILAVLAALALSGPSVLYAQDGDEQDGEDHDTGFDIIPERRDSESTDYEVIPPSGPDRTPDTTETVVAALSSATRYCQLVQPGEYVIDCLAERLGEIRSQLEGQDEFDEVRAVLDTTSRKLNAIARQNRSDTLAPATFSTQGQDPVRTSRRLVPVDAASLEGAVSEALIVIGEAETLLLRSAEQSADRSIQFQQIAAAIGSNKVLLRSA